MLNNEANVAWNWRSNRHVAGPSITSFLSCNDAGKTHFLLILREFASSFAVDVLDEQSMSDSLSAFSSKRDYVVNSWYAIKNWSTTCAIIISDWRMGVECKTTSVVSGTSSFRQVFNFIHFSQRSVVIWEKCCTNIMAWCLSTEQYRTWPTWQIRPPSQKPPPLLLPPMKLVVF